MYLRKYISASEEPKNCDALLFSCFALVFSASIGAVHDYWLSPVAKLINPLDIGELIRSQFTRRRDGDFGCWDGGK